MEGGFWFANSYAELADSLIVATIYGSGSQSGEREIGNWDDGLMESRCALMLQ